jgi:hypothetical protein
LANAFSSEKLYEAIALDKRFFSEIENDLMTVRASRFQVSSSDSSTLFPLPAPLFPQAQRPFFCGGPPFFYTAEKPEKSPLAF